MKIEQIKIKDLIKYELNAKIHPESQINGLVNSIKRFGFIQPLVISKEKEIIIGHARFEAAKKLEMEKVPCLMAENLSESEIKALRLIDNRIAETSWDSEFLKKDLEFLDFDFDDFNLDFNFINTTILESKKNPEGAKELSEDDFKSFDTVCPKCNFEFNRK